jgi:ketosteroid isomerase-like protein
VRAVALAVALAACGGGGGGKAAAPAEPAVDERAAEKDAKGLLIEMFRTIDHGQTDSMFALLSDPVIVLGPRRGDAMATRADALVALGRVVDPRAKRHPQLQSSGLSVAVSQGGRSAWAFDVVRYDGHDVAVTAVLSNAGDLWAVSAAALAVVPTAKQVRAGSARDAIVPPGATAAARVGPGAAAAVDEFKKGLLDQDSWGVELMSQSDAIVAGPTAGEVARGKQQIRHLWKSRMKAHVREATSGELTAAVTADGQLAWLSAPVTRVADGEDPLPLRVFAVYAKDGAAWRLIVLHEGLAIDEPGSGAAFKKMLPPAPEAPRAEPAKPDADDKPASPVKKKKKRRKPPPPSDD